mgnify:CR=1 FL=1
MHHTDNPKAGFSSIVQLLKPGGIIIVGLYDQIDRLRTDLRRILYKVFGENVLKLDPNLKKNISIKKREAWIQDQYLHPHETKHTMRENLFMKFPPVSQLKLSIIWRGLDAQKE